MGRNSRFHNGRSSIRSSLFGSKCHIHSSMFGSKCHISGNGHHGHSSGQQRPQCNNNRRQSHVNCRPVISRARGYPLALSPRRDPPTRTINRAAKSYLLAMAKDLRVQMPARADAKKAAGKARQNTTG